MVGALVWWLKGRESGLSFDKDLDVGPADGGESLHLGCLLVIVGEYHFPASEAYTGY